MLNAQKILCILFYGASLGFIIGIIFTMFWD